MALFMMLACRQVCLAQADFQGATHLMPFDDETIRYGKTKDLTAVARLQAKIDRDEVKLAHDDAFGYLLAVLEELKISTNSQLLVFSRTSFQRDRIGPRTPRALYFNDDVYVGFIPRAPVIEVSAVDPRLGAVFYTLDQVAVDKPKFVRSDQCLECHASSKTMGVPGHVVRSFETDERGIVDRRTGVAPINHRTPLDDRWGGWYVTGKHGAQLHRGNLIGAMAREKRVESQDYMANLSDLSSFFRVSSYPKETSGIVALMVHEHQTHMHNFLTRLNYEATIALEQYGHVKYLDNIVEAFLKYLLFIEETEFEDRLIDTGGFARGFVAQGPRDKRGRSLRDLDLRSRLFKYPCSYLIYSEAFDALPEKLKERVYLRLWEVLSGEDTSDEFESLSSVSRQAILEILLGTKSDLPDYWRKSG
jgi:hypothetical protein